MLDTILLTIILVIFCLWCIIISFDLINFSGVSYRAGWVQKDFGQLGVGVGGL